MCSLLLHSRHDISHRGHLDVKGPQSSIEKLSEFCVVFR